MNDFIHILSKRTNMLASTVDKITICEILPSYKHINPDFKGV